MIRLDTVPSGLDEIRAYYGNPDVNNDWVMDEGWLEANTRVYELPFPMRTWGGRTTQHFRAHRYVGFAIQDAMEAIRQAVGEEYLVEKGYDFWGGCWWFRKMTNHDALSTHSWGIAVDINPALAPYGKDPMGQPGVIVEAFTERGFDWGGDWRVPDGMHFQACTSY